MSYGADFANADPANAPLDAPIMIGANPALWGAFLLALAAALLIGWYFGQRAGRSRVDAADSIWEEIDDAAKEAMKADGDSLPARAAALRRTIDRRLGKTLGLAGGTGKAIKALDLALKGEAGDPPPTPRGNHGHAAGHVEKPGHPEPGPAPVGAVTVIVNTDNSHTGTHDSHAPHEGKKSLSVQERNDALRVAVGNFNDHWGLRQKRVRDLRDAHAELSTPGNAPHVAGKISGTRAAH